ncbi:MAG: ATP cone domain-containing protein, partial [Eubacteriales bacterium]|nr:ATP cone domain-containing protein [Eubacteriales bacterium]
MKTVIKRDGTEVSFDAAKIKTAIEKAMQETRLGVDANLSGGIAAAIEKQVERSNRLIKVEDLQDLVEDFLMASERKDVAKKFIIYRYERDKTRGERRKQDGRVISEDFISPYKHAPSPMNQLGSFVFYRTYSRWLPDESRREYWWETIRRAVEY